MKQGKPWQPRGAPIPATKHFKAKTDYSREENKKAVEEQVTKIEHYGTINFRTFTDLNDPLWPKIRKCNRLKHVARIENIGRCFNRTICDKCGYSYDVDSSD